jgi:hypothetical protein
MVGHGPTLQFACAGKKANETTLLQVSLDKVRFFGNGFYHSKSPKTKIAKARRKSI